MAQARGLAVNAGWRIACPVSTLWHALGAKTVQLIHENVRVEVVRDDLDNLVMDAEVLESLISDPDPEKKAKEIEIKLIQRLRKHAGERKFVELGEHTGVVLSAAWSPDGHRILTTGDDDHTARVWDARSSIVRSRRRTQ